MSRFITATIRFFGRVKLAVIVLFKLLRHEPTLSLKYGYPFFRSFIGGRLPVEDEFPLISLKAIAFLDKLLEQPLTVFEYGAGGTTAFVSRKARHHVFVEDVPGYFQQVVALLERHRRKVEAHCIEPLHLKVGERPVPHPEHYWVTYVSSHKAHQNLDFTAYVKHIENYPDRSFDLVIVDGRARQSCVVHAIPKIKESGYIMLDDSNRAEYREAFEYLEKHYRGIHLKGLRPYHTMIHTSTASNQQTSFWQIQH